MRAREFIVDAISLDKLRSASGPASQDSKDLVSRLKQSMPSKPRNFIAKNATKGGAGAHKDKKRADKQGDVKHKQKQFAEGVAEGKSLQDYVEAGVCPICHGDMVSEDQLEEGKKDACYHKIKASSKVWPSAYASGRLVQCRKAGAANYGKGKKK